MQNGQYLVRLSNLRKIVGQLYIFLFLFDIHLKFYNSRVERDIIFVVKQLLLVLNQLLLLESVNQKVDSQIFDYPVVVEDDVSNTLSTLWRLQKVSYQRDADC